MEIPCWVFVLERLFSEASDNHCLLIPMFSELKAALETSLVFTPWLSLTLLFQDTNKISRLSGIQDSRRILQSRRPRSLGRSPDTSHSRLAQESHGHCRNAHW